MKKVKGLGSLLTTAGTVCGQAPEHPYGQTSSAYSPFHEDAKK